MKPTRYPLLTDAVRAVICLAFAASAQAALIVQDSDISDSELTYCFNLSADQLTAFNLGGSLVSTSNITAISGHLAAYSTSASLTLAWDFSQTDYRPVSVDFKYSIYLFDWGWLESTAAVEWSTDGSDWTQLASINTLGPPPAATPWTVSANYTANAQSVTLSSSDMFYYRVTFTGTNQGNASSDVVQWGRTAFTQDGVSDLKFAANFTLVAVPEPSTCALILGVLALAGGMRFRRFVR